TCSNGTCGISCNQNFHRCGDACVSNNDVNSCGNACSPCQQPASDGVGSCDGTRCGLSCDEGFEARGTACLRVPTRIAAGGSTTCALFSDGSVECWGFNF